MNFHSWHSVFKFHLKFDWTFHLAAHLWNPKVGAPAKCTQQNVHNWTQINTVCSKGRRWHRSHRDVLWTHPFPGNSAGLTQAGFVEVPSSPTFPGWHFLLLSASSLIALHWIHWIHWIQGPVWHKLISQLSQHLMAESNSPPCLCKWWYSLYWGCRKWSRS